MKKYSSIIIVSIAILVALFVVSNHNYNKNAPTIDEGASTNGTHFAQGVTVNTGIPADWCGEPVGEIRTVGAWSIGDGLVEDEQGNVWNIGASIAAEDFLMLWIDDNGTQDNAADDVVIKVWREAH